MTTSFLRGNIYFAHTDYGDKPFLVVSNNARNSAFDSAIAVRITTTPPKSPRPSVVPLTANDPLVGYVLCDSIETLWNDEPVRPAGGLSRATMYEVGEGLKAALGLR